MTTILAVLASLVPGYAQAEQPVQVFSHAETAPYLNDGASVLVGCTRGALPFTIGGACLSPQPEDISIRVAINDALTKSGSGSLAYFDASGTLLLVGSPFCGSTTEWIPPGTTQIRVWLDGATSVMRSCQGQPATRGEVVGQFWKPAPQGTSE